MGVSGLLQARAQGGDSSYRGDRGNEKSPKLTSCRLRAADGYHQHRKCDVFATQGSPVPWRWALVKFAPQFPALDVKAECTFPDVPVPVENVFTLPSPSWPLCLFTWAALRLGHVSVCRELDPFSCFTKKICS